MVYDADSDLENIIGPTLMSLAEAGSGLSLIDLMYYPFYIPQESWNSPFRNFANSEIDQISGVRPIFITESGLDKETYLTDLDATASFYFQETFLGDNSLLGSIAKIANVKGALSWNWDYSNNVLTWYEMRPPNPNAMGEPGSISWPY